MADVHLMFEEWKLNMFFSPREISIFLKVKHVSNLGLCFWRSIPWQIHADSENLGPFLSHHINIMAIWMFPKIMVPPKWMVYNGKPY